MIWAVSTLIVAYDLIRLHEIPIILINSRQFISHCADQLSRVARNPTLFRANIKGADQPAHKRSLISAFVFRFLKNIIILLARYKNSIFWLVPVAEQAGLRFTWSQTP